MFARLLRRVSARARSRILHSAILRDRARASAHISKIADLDNVYRMYRANTLSAVAGVSDYWRLYLAVRALKPMNVLECGTGLSTTAIGIGLAHNERDYGIKGMCVSMEESQEWYDHATMLLPVNVSRYVEIVLSSTVEKAYKGIKGVCYREVPDMKYDFVFVDGPNEASPLTGEKLFDLEMAYVAEKNPQVQAFVDHRLNTVRYLKQVLIDSHDVIYHPVTKLGYVYPKGCGRRILGL